MTKNEKMLTLKLSAIEGCTYCANEECKKNGNVIQVIDSRGINPEIGSTIEVELAPIRSFKLMVILIAPAVILFMVGYIVFSIYSFPEWTRFIAGFIGLGIGFFISFISTKDSTVDLPVVKKIIQVDMYDDTTENLP